MSMNNRVQKPTSGRGKSTVDVTPTGFASAVERRDFADDRGGADRRLCSADILPLSKVNAWN
jgi:hypothetical protein